MNYKHTTITAFRSLVSHKTRAALTILGIVIGVASIIVVMALGSGAQELIVNQISGLGAETLVIRPGKSATDFTSVLLSQTLTQKDLDALEKKSNVPHLVSASPFVFIAEPIMHEGDTYQSTIIGGSAEFISNTFDAPLEDGYVFTQSDIDTRNRVAVIGAGIRDDVFGTGRVLGENIRIKNQKFRVVGVFEEQGQVGPFDFDKMVIVPHTAAQTYITGNDFFQEVFLKIDSAENVEKSVYDVTQTMREQHDIGPTEEDDFHIQTQKNLIDQIGTVISILTSFLTAVVAISLVVGGIGIMNIMLVSVTERTKEIGLRKALGATKGDILRQFLFEAMMLTGIGGIIGILLGAFIAFIGAIALSQTVADSWTFTFPISAAVIGVIVSTGVGLIFGIYPASQAAKKSPIEALRYE